jgi:class 3 adenylate cyclase/tetratricopeptide (TPR) repeat protein
VTVLFCDVVGSTEIGERLDPESVRRVMSRYFDETRSILERHGATVEKFIGDAVMAAFGVPRAHEDDAERAVRAAVEMRDGLHALNEELERTWGVGIRTRIGVNTGEVVAGDPSAGESFVTGDTVNVAARLEQAAGPGEVLIGGATHGLVADVVKAEAVTALKVKGKTEPIVAHRVIEVLPRVGGHTRRFDSPMVGREAERAQLEAAFQQVLTERSCHLVTVLGAAGVGKTRLVEEFLSAVGGTATILRGRCLPYGDGITYWPFLDLVRQAARLGDADSPEDARGKIDAVVGPSGDGPEIAEHIARLLGVSSGPASQEAFRAARRFLETLALTRPLIAVVDDLQWAEPRFLDLVQYVTDRARAWPILLLCMARPELLQVRPGWAGVDPYVSSVVLDPLADDESDRLVRNLLGAELPRDERSRIVTAAEGNPLFIEEMLWMLIERGLLRRSNGSWVPAGDLSSVPVPPTVQAILAARLDALDPPERTVIERAAVIGEVFYWRAVADLAPEIIRPDVGTNLMTLERRQLIKPAPSDLEREDAYRFRHLLVRDAAYAAIPKSSRAEVHEAFAGWLERVVGERLVEYQEIVGYHLEQAHRCLLELGPPDDHARELASRASNHLVAAGMRAWDRGDERAAENLLHRALELLPGGDVRRVPVLLTLTEPFYRVGWLVKESMAEEALAIGSSNDDPVLVARSEFVYLTHRAFAHPGAVLPEEIAAAIDQAVPILEAASDARSVTSAQLVRGQIHEANGKMAAAMSWYERALETAAGEDLPRAVAMAAASLGSVLLYGPTPADYAIARLRRLMEEARGNRLAELELGWRLGLMLLRSGDRADGASTMEGMRAEAQDLGYQTAELYMDFLLFGQFRARDADLETCERGLRRMIDVEADDIGWMCSILAELAIVLCGQDRFEEAEAVARRSLQITAPGDLHPAVTSRAALARCRARRGHPDEALELAREAVSLTDGTDWPDIRVIALRALADALRRGGREEEAAAALRECITLYEAKGFGPSAQVIRADLADLSRRRDRGVGRPPGPGRCGDHAR